MTRETELLPSIVQSLEFVRMKASVSNFACRSRARFLNSASDFQSTCDSIYAQMTRLIPHVMRSHMEYKCIFIWVLTWYVLPPTHRH